MPAAGIVTVVLVAVAIVVIALFLIRIGAVLRQISLSLHAVVGAVASIPDRTEAIAPILTSINDDLGTARGVLEGLLAKKLGPPAEPSRIVHRREIQPEMTLTPASPPGSAPAPDQALAPESQLPARPDPPQSEQRIVYRRETPAPQPAAPEFGPETPSSSPAPDSDERPAVIRYRRGGQ